MSGIVVCISAGLLAAVVTAQRPAATDPGPGSPETRAAVTISVGLTPTPATAAGWTGAVTPALAETVAVPEPPVVELARPAGDTTRRS